MITYALAAAIRKVRKEHAADFIFTGKQTIDGDTAQVGPGLRSGLGCRRLTYVGKIRALDLTVRTIQTERRAEGGVQVLLTSPYLIRILEATTRCAAAPWPDALRAARAPMVKWNAQDAGLEDLSKCGLADRDQVSLRSLGVR